jgi:HAD superfamily hydrolase (TIGR01490 family)
MPMSHDDSSTPSPPPERIAAFFDIDNTIMRGTSIYHLARGLFSRKILSASDLTNFALVQGRFLMAGTSESIADLAKITESALSFVTGRTTDELASLCEEIYDEIMADKVWPGTVELAHTHRATGHQVWLVSAAPIELANIIAIKLGLTGAVATVSEIVDGVYTGKLQSVPMHGTAKADALHKLAKEHDIDLAASFAYSDSSNDIPLLTVVGHPTAVNPDTALRQYAEKHNWPIYDFRRQRLIKNYAIPASATALALLGAGAGMAMAASRRSRAEKSL